MAAPKKFRVRERMNRDGSATFYARFTDQHGIRREFPLGRTPDWNARLAQREVEHIQADVERGMWSPKPGRSADPQRLLFADMAYDWWHNKIAGRKALRTQAAYKAELTGHLVPFFGGMAVAAITKYDIDTFTARADQKGLSAAYINSQVQLLGQILDLAMDWYDNILPANPARGKHRRVEGRKSPDEDRWLTADQVELLLRAARELDKSAKRDEYQRLGRESAIGCLCFSGLRNTELCELTWDRVKFDRRIIQPGGTKTETANRDVNIVDGLLPLLIAHRNQTRYRNAADPVWPTANGKHRNKDLLNRRIVQPVVMKARELIQEDEERSSRTGEPRRIDVVLPSRITPHTFRRTFCGFATEETQDPYYVQQQMGHRDAKFTYRVYNRVRSWTGERDPRVLAWMNRPQRDAPTSRLRLAE
jgi:integrase